MPNPRRPLTYLSHLITWTLVAFVLFRLAPHLAALLGIETGPQSTPAYAVRTLDGATLTADSLRGRVVLVNFWATWCPPCRVEMPFLQSLAERHRDAGLVVLGLLLLMGNFVVGPNEARVLTFFGRYTGTVRDAGLRWANPCPECSATASSWHCGAPPSVSRQRARSGPTESSSSATPTPG